MAGLGIQVEYFIRILNKYQGHLRRLSWLKKTPNVGAGFQTAGGLLMGKELMTGVPAYDAS